MVAWVIPAAIAAAKLAGSVMSNASANNATKYAANKSYQAAKETNEWNYKMFQEQNQWNLDQWNRENAYNDPSQQVARLQSAGLNPYLMLGGSSAAGVASHMTSASAAPGVTPDTSMYANMKSGVGMFGDALSAAAEGVQMGLQMENQASQNKIAASDAKTRDDYNYLTLDNMRSQGALTKSQSRKAFYDAVVASRTVNSRVSQSENDANTSFWKSRLAETDANTADKTFSERMKQSYFAFQVANELENMKLMNANLAIDEKTKKKNYEWIDKTNQQLWKEMQSRIDKNQSDIERNTHLNSLTDAQKDLCIEEKKAKEIENIINGDPNVQDAKKMQEYIKSAPTTVQQAIFADPWYQRYIKTIREGKKPTYEVSWNVKRLYQQYGLISGNMNVATGVTLGNTFGTSVGSSRQNSDTPK